MNSTIIKILVALIGLVALFGAVKLLNASLDKSEVVSCLGFVEDAKNYQQFFITDVENEMCLRHGITIHAPVVTTK